MRGRTNYPYPQSGGFTLVEVLTAAAMGAVILLAVQSLLYGAMRLRENAEESIRLRHPAYSALTILKRDLANMVAPGEILCGSPVGETGGGIGQRQDRLELYTSTGVSGETLPWGDVQRVQYYLQNAKNEFGINQAYLVRSITRNLLSTLEEIPQNNILLEGVQSLAFSYYNGQSWLDSWDSTTQATALPIAIGIRLVYAPLSQKQIAQESRQPIHTIPIETIVPVVVTAEESASAETGGSAGTEVESNPGGGATPGGGTMPQGGRNQGGQTR